MRHLISKQNRISRQFKKLHKMSYMGLWWWDDNQQNFYPQRSQAKISTGEGRGIICVRCLR